MTGTLICPSCNDCCTYCEYAHAALKSSTKCSAQKYQVTHLDSKHAVVSIIGHVGPAGTPLSLPHSSPHVCQLFTNGCHAIAGLHNLVQLSLLALLRCSKLCVELPLQPVQCSASTKTSLNAFCLFSSHTLQQIPAVDTVLSIYQSISQSMLPFQFA